MSDFNRTVIYDRHLALGAKIVEFAGWQMPIQYKDGIVKEHLATRKASGVFDVSHMGRFIFSGTDAMPFLQHVLTNNAAAIEPLESQYTIIADETGGAIDDAYLYRFVEDEYLLVVNAANKDKDWSHFQKIAKNFKDLQIADKTAEISMVSLQGPQSRQILLDIIESGDLPEPLRNYLSIVKINGSEVMLARTGYTGEPICFELFINSKNAPAIWDILIEKGAATIGLGARDTLRLEAGLPLYGHEFGLDSEGKTIPIFSCALARFAVSFSPLKGSYIGREPLYKQFKALKRIIDRDYSLSKDLPRITLPIAMNERGIARQGDKVYRNDKHIGYITSGTMVPYWDTQGDALQTHFIDEQSMRAISMAMIDNNTCEGDDVEVEIRGKKIKATVVPYHLRTEAPPYARSITCHDVLKEIPGPGNTGDMAKKVHTLINKAVENHNWRQNQCINLIPSEQSVSPMTKRLCMLDPSGRYAEHKQVKAFKEADIFFYQGTDFILEVEKLLDEQMRLYLGCTEVESRLVSGQMANTAVFSALVDFINRADRKSEQRRIRYAMNNHIIKGGHLSAQPMGALRDFVARDPKTEKPAVVNFPVLPENHYKIDVAACEEIIERYKPELIILGKSVVLHPEPVAEMRALTEQYCPDAIIMYDMAHVLGLVGPYFQQPFKEGADIVTGSTHKTFFGPQRGIIGANYARLDLGYQFFEAIQRRAFPGSVSNHHLGTLLGLLMAAYEMNHFKDKYQKAVIDNAKTFAVALHDCGLDVAGDQEVSYTQTHQVIVNVGYSIGPKIAARLEDNNIITNYQACPEEEGFTASGAIRIGVSEMTRFGMEADDFKTLAEIISDLIINKKNVKDKIIEFRKNFLDMKYCFNEKEFDDLLEKLHKLV